MNSPRTAAERSSQVQELVNDLMARTGYAYNQAFAQVQRAHPELFQAAQPAAGSEFSNERASRSEFIGAPCSIS